MKSIGFIVLGFAGQVAATFASLGLAELAFVPSNIYTATLFIGTLAFIGLLATIFAGLEAMGHGRVWALVVSSLFFTAVVVLVAGSLYSLTRVSKASALHSESWRAAADRQSATWSCSFAGKGYVYAIRDNSRLGVDLTVEDEDKCARGDSRLSTR